jgi:hypothetical protein
MQENRGLAPTRLIGNRGLAFNRVMVFGWVLKVRIEGEVRSS